MVKDSVLRKRVSELTGADKEELRKWFTAVRPKRAKTLDLKYIGRSPAFVKTWFKHPGRYDIPGVDTGSARKPSSRRGSRERKEVKERERKAKEREIEEIRRSTRVIGVIPKEDVEKLKSVLKYIADKYDVWDAETAEIYFKDDGKERKYVVLSGDRTVLIGVEGKSVGKPMTGYAKGRVIINWDMDKDIVLKEAKCSVGHGWYWCYGADVGYEGPEWYGSRDYLVDFYERKDTLDSFINDAGNTFKEYWGFLKEVSDETAGSLRGWVKLRYPISKVAKLGSVLVIERRSGRVYADSDVGKVEVGSADKTDSNEVVIYDLDKVYRLAKAVGGPRASGVKLFLSPDKPVFMIVGERGVALVSPKDIHEKEPYEAEENKVSSVDIVSDDARELIERLSKFDDEEIYVDSGGVVVRKGFDYILYDPRIVRVPFPMRVSEASSVAVDKAKRLAKMGELDGLVIRDDAIYAVVDGRVMNEPVAFYSKVDEEDRNYLPKNIEKVFDKAIKERFTAKATIPIRSLKRALARDMGIVVEPVNDYVVKVSFIRRKDDKKVLVVKLTSKKPLGAEKEKMSAWDWTGKLKKFLSALKGRNVTIYSDGNALIFSDGIRKVFISTYR